MALGIGISVVAIAKGRKMQDEMGVSYKTYLLLVVVTEVFYAIGALMILSAMGLNVIQHLAKLDFGRFYEIASKFDLTTMRIVGVIGWIGFVINRAISFVSPGYLLIRGGRKLSKYFWYSAWSEVGLEVLTTSLVFTTLKYG